MRQIFILVLFFTLFSCGENKSKLPIGPYDVIIEAINLKFDDLDDNEKEDMIFTRSCCYPENWNRGVDCIEKENAFYVKAKININLLAALSESETFTRDKLITSNPHTLYGKYINRWQFLDDGGNEICETSKNDGHNDFRLIRKDTIDEIIIGPLPKKPSKILIKINESKYYKGVTPTSSISH